MDYEKQNYFISSLIHRKEYPGNKFQWEYFCKLENLTEIKVCYNLILNLFQFSEMRLRTVRKKLKDNSNFVELRGGSVIRDSKINGDIFKEFIDKFPKIKSHYTNSQKLYFIDRDLNYTKLFELYKSFLIEKKIDQGICLRTFTVFFKNNYDIKFKPLRSDYCDFCFENEKDGIENLQFEARQKYLEHQNLKDIYKNLKTSYKSDEKYIVIEFDYAQNRPLPKLPNCNLFYKRLLWLYIFNVHVHGIKSFIFYSLEGNSPKNPNSVCSALFEVLQFLKENNHLINKELIFVSDSTCSQNKNWALIKFLSYISIKFSIKITHLFPVKGHSFSICDSNFSLITSFTKKIEKIEHPDVYLEVYRRNSKFTVLESNVFNYNDFLSRYFNENRKVKIMKIVKFQFFSSGDIFTFTDYSSDFSDYFNLLKDKNPNFLEIINKLDINSDFLIKNIGLSKEKISDLKSILKYISSENIDFYNNHLKNTNVKL